MDWECMGNGLMDWWISVMLHSDFCLYLYRWTKRVRRPDKSEDFLIFFAFAWPPWVIRLYLQLDRCCVWLDMGCFGCRLLILGRSGMSVSRFMSSLFIGAQNVCDAAQMEKYFKKVLNLEQKGLESRYGIGTSLTQQT